MRVCPRCKLKYPNDQDRCFVDREVLVEAADENLGRLLAGRYLVESVIGEGGMATVYRARHTLVDRPVAVKILHARMAASASLKERFRREATHAARLAHPNIIEIHDYGETEEGSAFLVMELLRGSPLTDNIPKTGMLPDDVIAIGMQIAGGLARAHDFDVIHRDLKPDNVFLCETDGDPLVKLLDFGIARSLHDTRLTNAGEIFGTPPYMAPERVTSIDAGPSADLYALGVIYFEMLTGRLPFESEEVTGYFVKHMREPPPRPSAIKPDTPPGLEKLILSLLGKRPEERPVDAHQVVKELTAMAPRRVTMTPALSATRPAVAPTLPPTTLERWARRAVILDEMLARAFPGDAAPQHLRAELDAIRGSIQRIHALRGEGLLEQRKLEAFQADARERRARLGHAVQSLAEDLSTGREALRVAQSEVEPVLAAEREARAAYVEAQRAVAALDPLRALDEPDARASAGLRAVADAIDLWAATHARAENARRWLEAKRLEGADLEYQVKMLRAQLEKAEEEVTAQREASERILVASGTQAEKLEADLLAQATRLCTALRARGGLADLFEKLEAESG